MSVNNDLVIARCNIGQYFTRRNEKLVKYLSYCTQRRTITGTYCLIFTLPNIT